MDVHTITFYMCKQMFLFVYIQSDYIAEGIIVKLYTIKKTKLDSWKMTSMTDVIALVDQHQILRHVVAIYNMQYEGCLLLPRPSTIIPSRISPSRRVLFSPFFRDVDKHQTWGLFVMYLHVYINTTVLYIYSPPPYIDLHTSVAKLALTNGVP